MIHVEFHCHSTGSPDSLVDAEQLIRTARQAGLDRIFITDHNSIHEALRAQALAPDLVLIGEEVMTDQGEILAYLIKEKIPSRMSPMETIAAIREQGGVISISHPFDPRRGWKLENLEKIYSEIDALEVFNARNLLPEYNLRALEAAQNHGLLSTAGSDAHTKIEIGRTRMIMPDFNDRESMLEALRVGMIIPKESSPLVRFNSTFSRVYRRMRKSWETR
ncbi:MAG: PHP domain-containing protein [Anaerolineaceae bacterium]|nr:PHP domain-containing protein [Anaerolineaceae bacterium]